MICEKDSRSDIPAVDKRKYLIPMDLTVGQVRDCGLPAWLCSVCRVLLCYFLALSAHVHRPPAPPPPPLPPPSCFGPRPAAQFVYVIRKRISIPSDKAIFIFVNNTLPPTSALMSTVYEQHKDADGFMYMMYSGENTFGGDEA